MYLFGGLTLATRRPEHEYWAEEAEEPDGYVAYPVGLKGVVVAQGDTYEEALADARSAITFHIETFEREVLEVKAANGRCPTHPPGS